MEDAIKDAFEEDKSGLGNAVACGVVWRAVLHGVRRYVACGITWRAALRGVRITGLEKLEENKLVLYESCGIIKNMINETI